MGVADGRVVVQAPVVGIGGTTRRRDGSAPAASHGRSRTGARRWRATAWSGTGAGRRPGSGTGSAWSRRCSPGA